MRWCAWPTQNKLFEKCLHAETKPSVEKQNNNEMNERSASSLFGFLGIEPPRLSPPDMPSNGDGVAKFQVVSKNMGSSDRDISTNNKFKKEKRKKKN